MNVKALVAMFLMLLYPSLAQSGCIQPVGNLYVHLFSNPISPSVGEQTELQLLFADAEGTLQENVSATVSVKFGDFVVLEKYFTTDNGRVPFQLTFNKPGTYALSVDFQRASQGSKLYQPEAFSIQVRSAYSRWLFATMFLFGMIIGYGLYKFELLSRVKLPWSRKRRRSKTKT